MNARWQSLLLALATGLLLPVGLLLLLETRMADGPPVAAAQRWAAGSELQAQASMARYVATTGVDAGGCTNPASPCRTVQYAVDQAASGDEILVAQGTYTGVQTRNDLSQVVYISKTVSVGGGYTTTNWTTPYPITRPTILDAQGQGRVIYVTGSTITPTIEGLRITGGSAGRGVGGGVYVDEGAVTLRGNVIFANSTGDGGGMFVSGGGGVFLTGGSAALISNTIQSNTVGTEGYGGGVYVMGSNATLISNIIQSNTVGISGYGGGVYMRGSNAALISNTIESNAVSNGFGGGVYMLESSGVVRGNTISANTAQGSGGGLVLWSGSTLVEANTIVGNLAQSFSAYAGGGGVYLASDSSTLQANSILSNTASTYGGGVYVHSSPSAKVIANLIQGNQSDNYGGGIFVGSEFNLIRGNTIVTNSAGSGGGIGLRNSSPGSSGQAALEGNVIRGNLGTNGAGVYVSDGRPVVRSNLVAENRPLYNYGSGMGIYIEYASLTLAHNTIARNLGADGDGVYVTNGASATFLNTIVASQTVGVKNNSGTVTMNRTLWQGNGANVSGAVTDTDPVSGTVAFAADGYHLTIASAAIDAGTSAGGEVDVDGQPRRMGPFPDLGADEFPYEADFGLTKVRLGSGPVNAGAPITFTLTVTNAGPYPITDAQVVDTVSPAMAVAGMAATAPGSSCQASANVATCVVRSVPTDTARVMTVVVTPTRTYNGVLTNTATVTPTNGVDSNGVNNAAVPVATHVVYVPPAPDLRVGVLGPAYAQPSQTITYTISWANQGETTAASVTLTDILPLSVTYQSATGNPTVIDAAAYQAGTSNPTVIDAAAYQTANVNPTGQLVVWNLGALAAGASGIHSLTALVAANLPDGTVVNNRVRISTPDPGESPQGNTAQTSTTVSRQSAAMEVSQRADAEEVRVGDVVVYTLVISNSGRVPIAPVLTNPLPQGTRYLAGTATATRGRAVYEVYEGAGARLRWSDSSGLQPGQSVTIRFDVQVVDASGVRCGLLRNVASVEEPAFPYLNREVQLDTLVLAPDLQVKVEAPAVIHYKEPNPDGGRAFWVTVVYTNARQVDPWGNHSLGAAGVVLTATLVGWPPGEEEDNPHGWFVGAEPSPTRRDGGNRWLWDLGRLEPGQSGQIRLWMVPGTHPVPGGSRVSTQIMGSEFPYGSQYPAECRDRRDNTDQPTIWETGMDFQMGSTQPRLVFSREGGVPHPYFLEEYIMRYNYRNSTRPVAPAVAARTIEDRWPPELELDQQASEPSLSFRQVGPSKLRWQSGEPLYDGSGGWVRMWGLADARTVVPETWISNAAVFTYTLADGYTFKEEAQRTNLIPLIPPYISEPGNGQACPGEVPVRGLTQPGTAVRIYVDDTIGVSAVIPDAQGQFTTTLSLNNAGTYRISARAYRNVAGTNPLSDSSNVVTVNVQAGLGWCPQRSYWTGTIQAGPLQGRPVTYQFRDHDGNAATQGWVIPGVYGFWNSQLNLWGCGCDSISATQTITVTADGHGSTQSQSGSPQWFNFTIQSAHQGVRIETSCSDRDQGTSTTGDVLIDPDGYVFDVTRGLQAVGTTSEGTPVYTNTLQGITVTAYVSMTQWGGWVPWPAHMYNDQINPQVTGPDGYFAFFTPPGFYYLQVDGIPGYQSWRSPVVQVISQIVHVNVPLTPLPTGTTYTVTVTPEGLSPGVITVPVGSGVAWLSTLSTTATITDAVSFVANPILHPLSALSPLTSTLGWDGGMLGPGQVYRRQFTQPGTYVYADGADHGGQVVVVGEGAAPTYRLYLPLSFRAFTSPGAGW